jgi:glycerophosphoryl diester phosphodiesterase
MHDDTVDRTTSGFGNVSELTLADIRSLDAGRHKGSEFADQKVPIFPERPREDLAELVRLGVNGILTYVPELLRDLLAASGEAAHETTSRPLRSGRAPG